MRIHLIFAGSILIASLTGLGALPVPGIIVDWLIVPVGAFHSAEFCASHDSHPHCPPLNGGGATGTGYDVKMLVGNDPGDNVNWVADDSCLGRTIDGGNLSVDFRRCTLLVNIPAIEQLPTTDSPYFTLLQVHVKNTKKLVCATLWFNKDGVPGNENVYETETCLQGIIVPDGSEFLVTGEDGTLANDQCLEKTTQPMKGVLVGYDENNDDCRLGIDVGVIRFSVPQ